MFAACGKTVPLPTSGGPPVTDVLDLLAAGAPYEEILADYPFLEREDIFAAIEYAARQADHSVLHAS